MSHLPRRIHDEPAQPWRRVLGQVPVRVGRAKVFALSCGHRFTNRGRPQQWTQCARCPPEMGVLVASPAKGLKPPRTQPVCAASAADASP
jgi:hypothetical protein